MLGLLTCTLLILIVGEFHSDTCKLVLILDCVQAFFQGKLKISGNMGLAMKLKELQPQTKAKL